VDAAVPRRVDEHDRSFVPLPDDRAQHGHHRRDADASADQDHWCVGIDVEGEVPKRHAGFQLRAFGELCMKNIRNASGRQFSFRKLFLNRYPEMLTTNVIG
jgi:hypothetical protein